VGCVHLCRVAGNTVWSHMAGDPVALRRVLREKLITPLTFINTLHNNYY